jgi:hypothetical protein
MAGGRICRTEDQPVPDDYDPDCGKGCHYDPNVSAIQVKTDNSNPARYAVNYISFHNDKTWTVDDAVPPTKPQVIVSWQRSED